MTLSLSLRHSYRDFALDLEFEAPPGVTVLFGPSGAGKTSVVEAVSGLMRPEAGRLSLAGEVLFDTSTGVFVPPHRRRIGYVFQDARLFPHLSLRANLTFGRLFNRAAKADPIEPMLDLLGLAPLMTRRIADLSGGERARVALGRALLSGPRLLLLDEPLAALDVQRKAEVLPYLERLRDELSLPMLYVTHSPNEARRLGTQLLRLDKGKIVARGAPEAMLGDLERAEGAILIAEVTAEQRGDAVRWHHPAGAIWMPQGEAKPGERRRLHLPPEAVSLSLYPTPDHLAQAQLAAQVQRVTVQNGRGEVALTLTGGAEVFAHLPLVHQGRLAPGDQVTVLVHYLRDLGPVE